MKVILNAAAFKQVVVKQAGRAIRGFTRGIVARMKALMRQPKTGRISTFRGRRHQASAPGEAPAIRSGRLFRSIRESFPDAQTGIIEIDTPYAAFLEQGTSRGLAPRPFVRPAIKTVREQFNRGGLKAIAN